MNLELLSDQITEIKDQLRLRFKNMGLNKNQVTTKMNSIDCEFATHVFVNGIENRLEPGEERLKFYLRFLKLQLEELEG